MSIKPARALRETRDAFRRTVDLMTSMHGDIQVRPSESTEAIQALVLGDGVIRMECRPVVCRVPERASFGTAGIYVVFTGRIDLSDVELDGKMVTTAYATNFGYFKVGNKTATHALGGHYDYALNHLAHPRAHLQLRSQADLWIHAIDRFRSVADVPLGDDPMTSVLSRVRTPTAQMDFLSFMLQVSADHLVDDASPPGVRSTFEHMSSSCAPLLGYQRVTDAQTCGCPRASHWYPPH